MWGVSMANIKMMLADSISVLYGDGKDNKAEIGGEKKAMSFTDFMKTMHTIKRTKNG